MIKITSWNLNSVNARKEILVNLLSLNKPDVVLLQELKCQENSFPYLELEELGYNIVISGQKSFNGVAILSKYPISDVVLSFTNNPDETQARYIEGVISYGKKIIRVASVYVPNGTDLEHQNFQYKLKFLESLYQYYKNLLPIDEPLIIGGDFNVAHQDIDVSDESLFEGKIGYNIEERKIFRKFINLGLYDAFRTFYSKEKKFSWWDYRAFSWQKNIGMRIDYLLCSPFVMEQVKNCYMDEQLRNLPKPSDHIPVILHL
jgi:exodeoxyribonuclease-3